MDNCVLCGTAMGARCLCSNQRSPHSAQASYRAHDTLPALPQWMPALAKVLPAFEYLENRLTDNCESPYHMQKQHAQMRFLKVRPSTMCVHRSIHHAHTAFLLFSLHTLHLLYFTLTTCGVSCDAQVFDPAMATKEQPKAFLDIRAFTDHHSRCAQPHPRVESGAGHVHVSLAKDFKLIEKEDIPKYTEEVMTFWRENHTKIPTWARAARIVFSLSPPNSEPCELRTRVLHPGQFLW